MSRALDIPALRREWRMSRALKDADLNGIVAGDPATDNQANMDAIQQRHDERTNATFAAIIKAENKALTIRDAWAILNLALAVADDNENPEAARPLLEKAERVLKALRDAKADEPEAEPEEQPEPERPTPGFGRVLDPIEDKVSDLAALARLIADHGTNCTTDPSRYQGKAREREERMLQDVLTGLGFIRDEAERLEEFLAEHRMELSKSWPR